MLLSHSNDGRLPVGHAWLRQALQLQTPAPAVESYVSPYLYTKETRSSFAIEGETPNPNRTARFVAALQDAPAFDPADKAALVRLQGDIVDPRYAPRDWRDLQVYVSKTGAGFR